MQRHIQNNQWDVKTDVDPFDLNQQGVKDSYYSKKTLVPALPHPEPDIQDPSFGGTKAQDWTTCHQKVGKQFGGGGGNIFWKVSSLILSLLQYRTSDSEKRGDLYFQNKPREIDVLSCIGQLHRPSFPKPTGGKKEQCSSYPKERTKDDFVRAPRYPKDLKIWNFFRSFQTLFSQQVLESKRSQMKKRET